jgi:Xaa-Pro aminopeptidase
MKRSVGVWLLAFLCALGAPLVARQLPPFGGAAAFVGDLSARRARVMDALGPNAVGVFWSAPERVYSTDVNYEYRQDSTLLYLTGIDQPDSVLVLVPSATTTREILFVRAADARRELWNGHVPTPPESAATSGIKTIYTKPMFDAFMSNLLSGTASAETPAAEFGAFFNAVRAGQAQVAVLGGPTSAGMGRGGGRGAMTALTFPPPPDPPDVARAFADQVHARFPSIATMNAAPILNGAAARRGGGPGALADAAPTSARNGLRSVKTAYEQTVLRRSAEISAEAHIEGMKAARPGRWEYEVEAAIEYWYLKNGAMSWGYPSIVGSGPNATTLHYEASSRQMRDGDLLLVDAAANFQGLTADITRTYPVNGKFSQPQREIYELVLAAQDAAIAAAVKGAPTGEITAACRRVFGPGLLKLGLITDATSATQIGWWFPHGASHGIGYDVHDPLQIIDTNTAFTIEPGLYIRQDTIDNLPKDDATARIVATIQPAVTKYRNIGVRIEDSFLLTDGGLVTLSAKAPRSIAEIERLVGTGK